tara:strand:+ start:544 stop:1065 length:522 start_codon:yes stop_codon:yes gene_type:complete
MAFTAARVTSLSDTDRDRLINDSLEKIDSGNTFPFEAGLSTEQKKALFVNYIQTWLSDTRGYSFGISKDGLLVSLFVGHIDGSSFKSTYAFFGKDAGASRAYLYDDDWHSTLKTFLQSQSSLFTNFETINIENSPLATYNANVISTGMDTLDGGFVKETTDGVTYDKRITSLS